MSGRLKEWLKSGAILLLTVSAVFLAWKSHVFEEFMDVSSLAERYLGLVEPSDSGNGAGGSGESIVAAWPVDMAAVNDVGARCGVKYSAAQLNEMYEKTATIFGEALGSAAQPELCSEEEWRQALQTNGIYWRYSAPIPISLLLRWLGVSALNENGHEAEEFAAVQEDGSVAVYYTADGAYYRCATAAPGESLNLVAAEFLPNGAYFAFEEPESCKGFDPYAMILPELPEKQAVTVENYIAREGLWERASKLLAMDALGGASYTEKDGTMVLVGVNGILKLHGNGLLDYGASGYEPSAAEESMDAETLISHAFRLLSELRESFGGEETLCFDGAETEGERCTLRFAYYVDAAEIINENGAAARVVYENGRLLSLEMWMHRYSPEETPAVLLPELQAAAIAAGLQKGSEVNLVYYDGGAVQLEPQWMAG